MINDYIKEHGLTSWLVQNGGEVYAFGINQDKSQHNRFILQFNPGIAYKDNKIIASIRTVDYLIWMAADKDVMVSCEDFKYMSDDTIHSELYVGETDKENICLDNFKLVSINRPENLTTYKGIEDCRLVVWNGELYASGTSRTGTDDWVTRIHLSHLVKDESGNYYEDDHYVVPSSEYDYPSCEKNWMPVNDMPFTWIKWTNPTTVIRFDPQPLTVHTQTKIANDDISRNLRGSSNVITIGDYMYGIVHDVEIDTLRSEFYKRYLSYLVKFDKDFNLVGCSEKFTFDNTFAIQFVCGMIYDGEHIYISYSTDDASSYVVKTRPEYIISLV